MKNLYCVLVLMVFSISFSERLMPSDFEWVGGFRVPTDENWDWTIPNRGITYYPGGDASGPSDGYPGSLFGIGRDFRVSEITIPVPVASKTITSLNRASTLQGFGNISSGFSIEYPMMSIQYLPKQGSQTTDKIHIAYSSWYNVGGEDFDRYGWSNLTLSSPNTQGIWGLGSVSTHSVAAYLFEIPKAWADTYLGGKYLVTGRYRQGGWGGNGPSLHAYAPWDQGNPPPSGTTLNHTTILQYTDDVGMNDVSCGDTWDGGAWVTSGDKTAVILTGVKGFGSDFYGELCGGKGWHASGGYKPYMLFYDPDDLALVAQGSKSSWELQPYAEMDATNYIYSSAGQCASSTMGGAAYDRERNLLYVMVEGEGEYKEKPLVSVFRINGGTSMEETQKSDCAVDITVFPNPFNPSTVIRINEQQNINSVDVSIYNSAGTLVEKLASGSEPKKSEYVWNAQGLCSGVYLVKMAVNGKTAIRRITLLR